MLKILEKLTIVGVITMMNNKIGKIYNLFFKYYDYKLQKIILKTRMALIISKPYNDNEFIYLPVSSINIKNLIDKKYDYKITLPFSKDIYYIRTHKQNTAHINEIDFNNCLYNLNQKNPKIFYDVINLMKSHQENLIETIKSTCFIDE